MPIKRFPPPSFLPYAEWVLKDKGLNEFWYLTAILDEDAWYGGVDVTSLVLSYKAGNYRLWVMVDDCDDDETSGLSLPLSRTLLWEGINPTIDELQIILARDLSISDRLDYIFPTSDDYRDDYETDRFIYAPDCEFDFLNRGE